MGGASFDVREPENMCLWLYSLKALLRAARLLTACPHVMSRGLLTPKKSAVQGWCDRGAREEGEHLAEAEEAILMQRTQKRKSRLP